MTIKNYKEWDYTLILIALIIAIAMLSSCKTTECSYVRKNYIGYK